MGMHLMKNEKVLWKSYEGSNFRKFILIKDVFLMFLLLGLGIYTSTFIEYSKTKWLIVGGILVIGIIYIGINQLKLFTNLYMITDERVLIRRGWLSRKLTSIRLENIIDTKAEQSFKGRIIKSGSIYFFTANDSQNTDDNFIQTVPVINNVNDPFEEHSKILQMLKGISNGQKVQKID